MEKKKMHDVNEKSDENVILEAPIKKVVVLRNGVKITREGKTTLKEGKSVVALMLLPPTLDRSTLKVNGRGSGRIESINVENHYKETSNDEQIDKMEDELEQLRRERDVLDEKLAFLEEKAAHLVTMQEKYLMNYPFPLPENESLKYLAKVVVADKPGSSVKDRINSFVESTDELMKKTKTSIEAMVVEKKNLLLTIEEKQETLNQVQSSSRDEVFKQVLIDVNANKSAEFSFTVEYVLESGSWTPLYDVILDDDAEKVKVKMIAGIVNNTSEDWLDVNLTVSTANLRPIRIVEPTPWILRESSYQERLRSKEFSVGIVERNMKADNMDLFMSSDEIVDKPVALAATGRNQASIGGSALSVMTFQLPSNLSLESGMFPHLIHLVEVNLASKAEYVWTCSNEMQVIVQNVITNGDMQFLPGRARIFVDETLIGETFLDAVLPKEEFKLGTRESIDIKITKKLIKRSTDKGGMAKGKVEREYEYEIKVENLGSKKNDLIIMDRIPHSDSEQIKVKIIGELEPEPEEFRMGVIKWRIKLAEKPEKFTITYRYEVQHDRNIDLDRPLP
ncbi:MAG: mucoidy inhibitor MuiA family protein [Promethearchaeota archaeon]